VLLGGASRLQPPYRLMLALESGEWQNTSELAKAVHLSESEVAASQQIRKGGKSQAKKQQRSWPVQQDLLLWQPA